jgi:hypothetical protein
MIGKQTNSDDSPNIAGGSIHNEKYSRRSSSETNSCSHSIDSAKGRADPEDEALASNDLDFVPENDASATCPEQICKSDEPNREEKKSILQMNHKHHIVDESEAVSDISHSESEPSISEEWLPNESPHEQTRRSFSSIRETITIPSDHGSIQSLRENVDRVLMSSGRSRSDSRDCMQKTFSPAVAQMLYDRTTIEVLTGSGSYPVELQEMTYPLERRAARQLHALKEVITRPQIDSIECLIILVFE